MKNLLNCKKIHFIGILGSSMQNLAKISLDLGFSVTGSDSNYRGESLSKDIKIKKSFPLRELKNVDIAVFSSAIPNSNRELKFFQKKNVLTTSRAEFLALISKEFKCTIAISGSHGKTTVSGMIAHVLLSLGLSPCLHLGGNCTGYIPFSKDFFITEACEYRDSFLSLTPDVGVVLNVEYDHPDYFESLDHIYSSFSKFSKNSKRLIKGRSVNLSHPDTLSVGSDAVALDLTHENGYFTFTPLIKGSPLSSVTLSIPGIHNVENALITLLVVHALGLDTKRACGILNSFQGISRRYQKLHSFGREYVVDYAHHPSEIRAVIESAKLTKKPVTVYFQPHTYSRTKALFWEFVDALALADKVIIIREFPSRERPNQGVNAYQLFCEVNKRVPSIYATKKEGKERIKLEDTLTHEVLVLGAGDIVEILN